MHPATLNQIEAWIDGAPEIFIQIAIGTSENAFVIYQSGKIEPGTRNDIKDKWYYVNGTMLNAWSVETYSTVLRINFTERDKNCSNTDILFSTQYEDKFDNSTIKFGQTTTLNRPDQHVEFAEESIFWWQPRSFMYSQNGFSWELSN